MSILDEHIQVELPTLGDLFEIEGVLDVDKLNKSTIPVSWKDLRRGDIFTDMFSKVPVTKHWSAVALETTKNIVYKYFKTGPFESGMKRGISIVVEPYTFLNWTHQVKVTDVTGTAYLIFRMRPKQNYYKNYQLLTKIQR